MPLPRLQDWFRKPLAYEPLQLRNWRTVLRSNAHHLSHCGIADDTAPPPDERFRLAHVRNSRVKVGGRLQRRQNQHALVSRRALPPPCTSPCLHFT